jgi:hypothetical protein
MQMPTFWEAVVVAEGNTSQLRPEFSEEGKDHL